MLNIDDIYKDYARIVFKFLMSLCNDVDTAEELTQETFYHAIKSAKRYNGTCKDDRGKYPNQFSYGISKTEPFTDDDYIILRFKDKTETLYLKEIAEELGLQ